MEGLRYARAARTCSARMPSTWPPCSSGCPRRSFPSSPPTSAARASSDCSTPPGGRHPRGGCDRRLGRRGPSAGARARLCGVRLGPRHRRLRLRCVTVGSPGAAGRGRRLRHGERVHALDHLEPVGPRLATGRLAGIELISYSTGPSLGNLEAGLVEALSSLRFSIVFGGVACVLATGASPWCCRGSGATTPLATLPGPRPRPEMPPTPDGGRVGHTVGMRALTVHHVSVNVADLDEGIIFYGTTLGLPRRGDRPGDIARVPGSTPATARSTCSPPLRPRAGASTSRYWWPTSTPSAPGCSTPGCR